MAARFRLVEVAPRHTSGHISRWRLPLVLVQYCLPTFGARKSEAAACGREIRGALLVPGRTWLHWWLVVYTITLRCMLRILHHSGFFDPMRALLKNWYMFFNVALSCFCFPPVRYCRSACSGLQDSWQACRAVCTRCIRLIHWGLIRSKNIALRLAVAWVALGGFCSLEAAGQPIPYLVIYILHTFNMAQYYRIKCCCFCQDLAR